MRSGGESGPLVEAVAGKVNRDHVQQINKDSLWRNTSELASSSVAHAYKKPRRDGFCGLPDSGWWMFSHVRDGTFTIAVCRLRCGYRQMMGYGSSFLEEAFGGLMQLLHIEPSQLFERLLLMSADCMLVRQVQGYIAEVGELQLTDGH